MKPIFFSKTTAFTLAILALNVCYAPRPLLGQPTPQLKYSLGPDSMLDPAIPQGKIEEFEHLDSKVFPGTKRRFSVYVPQQYDPAKPTALMVFQDGHAYANRTGDYRAPVVMDNLIHRQEMPVTIGIFIDPGNKGPLPEKRGWKPHPSNRSVEYDTLSDDYVRFLETEILPRVAAKYNITQDASGRAICGASSGGICAFTAAWQRPDLFSKVVSHIGSFTNIRHGDQYPGMIRKTKKKPIRVYLQDGKNDLDNEHGNWPLGNLQMEKALRYKKYDFKFVFGDGAHNGNHGGAVLPDAMRWIWRGYPGVKTRPTSMIAQDRLQSKWWNDRHYSKIKKKNGMKQIDLLLLGDSITHSWEKSGALVWRQYFGKYQTLNLGFSGDRTEHLIWRIQNGEIDGIAPKTTVVMIGTNNTGHRQEPPQETADGVAEVIRELRTRLPNTKILLLGLLPRNKQNDSRDRQQNIAINDLLQSMVDSGTGKGMITYLDISAAYLDSEGNLRTDIMPDGLHPNRPGYEAWAKAMLPSVQKLLQE